MTLSYLDLRRAVLMGRAALSRSLYVIFPAGLRLGPLLPPSLLRAVCSGPRQCAPSPTSCCGCCGCGRWHSIRQTQMANLPKFSRCKEWSTRATREGREAGLFCWALKDCNPTKRTAALELYKERFFFFEGAAPRGDAQGNGFCHVEPFVDSTRLHPTSRRRIRWSVAFPLQRQWPPDRTRRIQTSGRAHTA